MSTPKTIRTESEYNSFVAAVFMARAFEATTFKVGGIMHSNKDLAEIHEGEPIINKSVFGKINLIELP